jgi:hypothetical protein
MRYQLHFRMLASAALAASALALLGARADADEFTAKFSGFQEVGALNAETGAIFTPAQARLDLDLNRAARTLTFTLTYSNLTAAILQSHIHFGKVHVPGGVIVFFCTNLNNGPAGTQACPQPSGTASVTVTGTIVGGNVVGPAAQNIPAGDFDGLVAALDSNTAYGNIHTTGFPAGEIRGQIHRGDRDDDDDGGDHDDHH